MLKLHGSQEEGPWQRLQASLVEWERQEACINYLKRLRPEVRMSVSILAEDTVVYNNVLRNVVWSACSSEPPDSVCEDEA